MFSFITDFFHIRGNKIKKIRDDTTRKVVKIKNQEMVVRLKDKDKIILQKDSEIEILKSTIQKLSSDHIKEISDIHENKEEEVRNAQKRADKRIEKRIKDLNEQQFVLDEKAVMLEELSKEYLNSIAKAEMISNMHNEQTKFFRQLGGVSSGLNDSLNILLEEQKLLRNEAAVIKRKIKRIN